MRDIFKIKEQLGNCDLCFKKQSKNPRQETFNNRIFFIPTGIIPFELKLHLKQFIDKYEGYESGFTQKTEYE